MRFKSDSATVAKPTLTGMRRKNDKGGGTGKETVQNVTLKQYVLLEQ
jgi:hypothetical protein